MSAADAFKFPSRRPMDLPRNLLVEHAAKAHKGGWRAVLLLQQAADTELLGQAAELVAKLPPDFVSAGRELLKGMKEPVLALSLALCSCARGSGGRSRGEDPCLDPALDTSTAQRILDKRHTARISKYKSKVAELAFAAMQIGLMPAHQGSTEYALPTVASGADSSSSQEAIGPQSSTSPTLLQASVISRQGSNSNRRNMPLRASSLPEQAAFAAAAAVAAADDDSLSDPEWVADGARRRALDQRKRQGKKQQQQQQQARQPRVKRHKSQQVLGSVSMQAVSSHPSDQGEPPEGSLLLLDTGTWGQQRQRQQQLPHSAIAAGQDGSTADQIAAALCSFDMAPDSPMQLNMGLGQQQRDDSCSFWAEIDIIGCPLVSELLLDDTGFDSLHAAGEDREPFQTQMAEAGQQQQQRCVLGPHSGEPSQLAQGGLADAGVGRGLPAAATSPGGFAGTGASGLQAAVAAAAMTAEHNTLPAQQTAAAAAVFKPIQPAVPAGLRAQGSGSDTDAADVDWLKCCSSEALPPAAAAPAATAVLASVHAPAQQVPQQQLATPAWGTLASQQQQQQSQAVLCRDPPVVQADAPGTLRGVSSCAQLRVMGRDEATGLAAQDRPSWSRTTQQGSSAPPASDPAAAQAVAGPQQNSRAAALAVCLQRIHGADVAAKTAKGDIKPDAGDPGLVYGSGVLGIGPDAAPACEPMGRPFPGGLAGSGAGLAGGLTGGLDGVRVGLAQGPVAGSCSGPDYQPAIGPGAALHTQPDPEFSAGTDAAMHGVPAATAGPFLAPYFGAAAGWQSAQAAPGPAVQAFLADAAAGVPQPAQGNMYGGVGRMRAADNEVKALTEVLRRVRCKLLTADVKSRTTRGHQCSTEYVLSNESVRDLQEGAGYGGHVAMSGLDSRALQQLQLQLRQRQLLQQFLLQQQWEQHQLALQQEQEQQQQQLRPQLSLEATQQQRWGQVALAAAFSDSAVLPASCQPVRHIAQDVLPEHIPQAHRPAWVGGRSSQPELLLIAPQPGTGVLSGGSLTAQAGPSRAAGLAGCGSYGGGSSCAIPAAAAPPLLPLLPRSRNPTIQAGYGDCHPADMRNLQLGEVLHARESDGTTEHISSMPQLGMAPASSATGELSAEECQLLASFLSVSLQEASLTAQPAAPNRQGNTGQLGPASVTLMEGGFIGSIQSRSTVAEGIAEQHYLSGRTALPRAEYCGLMQGPACATVSRASGGVAAATTVVGSGNTLETYNLAGGPPSVLAAAAAVAGSIGGAVPSQGLTADSRSGWGMSTGQPVQGITRNGIGLNAPGTADQQQHLARFRGA